MCVIVLTTFYNTYHLDMISFLSLCPAWPLDIANWINVESKYTCLFDILIFFHCKYIYIITQSFFRLKTTSFPNQLLTMMVERRLFTKAKSIPWTKAPKTSLKKDLHLSSAVILWREHQIYHWKLLSKFVAWSKRRWIGSIWFGWCDKTRLTMLSI